jgi:hypothetical protein
MSTYRDAHTLRPNPKRRKTRRTSRRKPTRRAASSGRARRSSATAPKKRRRRAARSRRRQSPAAKVRQSGEPKIRAFRLGTVLRVVYRHAQDGTNRYHNFKRGTPIAYTADRRFLIIPAPVKSFIDE